MLQFLFDTLIRTANLSLVALGLSLVYGLVRFANIAHVQFAMIGAFLTAIALKLGLLFLPAVAVSAAMCGLAAVMLHQHVFRILLKGGSANAMIGSLAVSMVMVALMLGTEGSAPVSYHLPLSDIYEFGDSSISGDQLVGLAITAIVTGLFCAFLFLTPQGRSIRALASNRDLAAASGLNAQSIIHSVNFIAGAMAGIGGSVIAMNGSAYINQGNDLMLPVLAAAILGGLGNPVGAIFGALLIAITETVVTNMDWGWLVGGELVFISTTWINASSFVILLFALLLRPYGLFDREVRRV